ncbi:uncharacterized protein GGS25DRAFT_509765 [Hypoxylon fragiforme]|uniref:uncharacterized protein n=1 Tax=Hypoxylon fragiforme TaxID=63214 RepID=UPI0020C70DB7|nr:uncharacterized protein GGS25DRAFT_509765 [Hypoxylon fragiforme]KAI2603060.1 hypothetical protein GGS25DRAFT_509765 [Hypoxylon fragiforme]
MISRRQLHKLAPTPFYLAYLSIYLHIKYLYLPTFNPFPKVRISDATPFTHLSSKQKQNACLLACLLTLFPILFSFPSSAFAVSISHLTQS